MATVIEYDGKQFLCTFSVPESGWIHDLAKSMGITKEAVLGAAINNGLTHYVTSFLCDDVVDKIKDQMEAEIVKPDNEGDSEPPKRDIDDNACDDVC